MEGPLTSDTSLTSVVSLPEGMSSECSRAMCRFTPRGSVAVYSAAAVATPDEPRGDDEADNDVCEVEWSSIVWNRPIRKLINQSHGLFMGLQKVVGDRGVEPKDVVNFSRLYRSALRECVIGLKDVLEDADGGEEEEEDYSSVEDQVELYSMLETAWHLCEVLFIETMPLGCLIQQLLEWVRWHNDHIDKAYHDVMTSDEPSEDPNYWSVVYTLTLQGRNEDVREILRHCPACQRNPKLYDSISELLRKMPMVRSVLGKSRTDLRGAWYEWKQECKRRRDRGDFSAHHNLDVLCGVLCGDEESFKDIEVKESCKFWYEMMVGRLFYCSPLVISTDYDLHLTAQSCIQQYIDVERMGDFDKILLTALQNNVIDVIKLSSSILSNWWFVAHLSNLLHHRGILVSHQLEYGSKLTEFVMIEYASSLFSHPSLWQIVIDYLSHCPTQGRHHLLAFIERVPLESERKALKVLHVCKQYGLTEQAQSICHVMAHQYYTQGQLGNALTWSIKSKDSGFAAFIAEKYFDTYELHGHFKDLALLDNLGDAMLLSKRLTFLGKYREIQVRYTKGDFHGAGELLVGLLESGTVPKKYWATLLTDTIPLLELEDLLVFNTYQTYALMRSLTQAQDDYTLAESTDDDSSMERRPIFDVTKEKLSLLQLSLARNLQRALLQR